MPFAKILTLEAGIRQSHYEIDAAGDPSYNATTWKVAGTWAPVDDIKFRANYQRAVRAPNIGELFAPVTTGLTSLTTDPCQLGLPVGNAQVIAACIAQGATAGQIGTIPSPAAGQANQTSGGNPFVGPETADTFSVGAVFTPTFLPGFAASVDYFDINLEEKVRIKDISFVGVTNVKEKKLLKKMDKTKEKKRFLAGSKFIGDEYTDDKKEIVKYFNTVGYRDARIISDSMWRDAKGEMHIQLKVNEGNRYYFRNLTWKGNSIYGNEQLDQILGIKKGDVARGGVHRNDAACRRG